MDNLGLCLFLVASLVRCSDSFLFGDTCINRCHSAFHSNDDYTCQCNSHCVQHGDCCDDYNAQCLGTSCRGRCNDHNSHHACQCNSHCTNYNDCCSDYTALCVDPTPVTVNSDPATCLTQTQVGQALWDNDVNRLPSSDITINFQSQISDGTSTDKSFSKLFTKVEFKPGTQTFLAFHNLLDNYDPRASSSEHTNSHETNEINIFLDSVLNTKVMAVLLDFLKCQGKASTKSDLKSLLQKIWFDFYQRSHYNAQHSTSGFEHVMVGEYKDTATVNGFHSWYSFYQKEKAGHINYLGYVSKSEPDLLGAAFTWDGHLKTKGTFFIGVSPEFDMAIYTLCYLQHKNDVCHLSVQGHSIAIKTFDDNGHLATAYVM